MDRETGQAAVHGIAELDTIVRLSPFFPPAVEVQSLNCWNARKLPEILLQPIQVAKFRRLKIVLLIRIWRKHTVLLGI